MKDESSCIGKVDNVLYIKREHNGVVVEGSFKKEDLPTQQTTGQELVESLKIGSSSYMPHGFFRKINRLGRIDFFGCFIEGNLRGKCWKTLNGGRK